jgi:hypothetical protein
MVRPPWVRGTPDAHGYLTDDIALVFHLASEID